MNRTKLTMVISLVLLAIMVTAPITIIEDAFARYQRHTGGDLSQAASISNSCLNPVSNSNTNDNMISNGNCGGTVSQQGASIPTNVQNANPTIEVQRSTSTAQPPLTTAGGNCTACFDPLSATQISDFETQFAKSHPMITTIAQLCAFLSGLPPSDQFTVIQNDVENALISMPHQVSQAVADSIGSCILKAIQ